MTVVKVTDAASEPVTLAEAKAHCRIDTSDEDALVTSLITAARIVAEHEMQRAIITSVFRLTTDAFPERALDLPFPALQSVATVKYYDVNNVQQTLSSALYRVDTGSSPGNISPVDTWPDTYARPDAVEVNYTSGWTNAAAVPLSIKQWILMRVATIFDNRADHATAREAADVLLPFVGSLLDPYRVYTL